MKKRQIEKDIPQLIEKNIITPDQGVEIFQFYAEKRSTLHSFQLLPLVGVFLIGAGFISLCAANWYLLPDPLKIFFALLPLVLLSFFLYRKRDTASPLMNECLTLAVAFAELFAFGIVTNIFQTPISTDLLMRASLICLVPMVYVFDGYWLGCLLYGWGISTSHEDSLLFSILVLFSFVPYCAFRLAKGEKLNIFIILHCVALFRLFLLFNLGLISFYLTLWILFAVSFLYEEELLDKLLKGILLLYGGISAFVPIEMDVDFPPCILLILGTMVFSGIQIYNQIDFQDISQSLRGKLGFSCYAFLALSFGMLPLFDFHTVIFTTILLFAYLGCNAYFSFLDGDLTGYNKHSALFSIFLFSKMTFIAFSFFFTGVLFIVTGTIFLVMSRFVNEKIKSTREAEELLLSQQTVKRRKIQGTISTKEENQDD